MNLPVTWKTKCILGVILAGAAVGCETTETKNLVDGTRTQKESWFHFRAEKEQLSPEDQRLEDARYLMRKK